MGTKTFQDVKMSNPTVAAVIASGGTVEDCVVELHKLNELYLQRLMRLEMYMPRRVKLPDGTVMVWHCPDEMIPEWGRL